MHMHVMDMLHYALLHLVSILYKFKVPYEPEGGKKDSGRVFNLSHYVLACRLILKKIGFIY